jgi:hypothetical protein
MPSINFNTALIIFLNAIRDDGRIAPVHISLYLAILCYSSEHKEENPICVFSTDLMPLAKISAKGTYHRCVRDLHLYGFIKYIPSHNHFLGSLVYIIHVE